MHRRQLLMGSAFLIQPVLAQPNLAPEAVIAGVLKRFEARRTLLTGFQVTQQLDQTVTRGKSTDRTQATFLIAYRPPAQITRVFQKGTRNGQVITEADLKNPVRDRIEGFLKSGALLSGDFDLKASPDLTVVGYETLEGEGVYKLQGKVALDLPMDLGPLSLWVNAQNFDPVKILVMPPELGGQVSVLFKAIGPQKATLPVLTTIEAQIQRAMIKAKLVAALSFENYRFN